MKLTVEAMLRIKRVIDEESKQHCCCVCGKPGVAMLLDSRIGLLEDGKIGIAHAECVRLAMPSESLVHH